MKLIIILILSHFLEASESIRVPDESRRYHLLRDYTLIDQFLKKERYETYLDLDITSSSGMKTLYNDFKNGTKDEPSWSALTEAQKNNLKQVKILALMNKYINSEKYLDIDLSLGIPLIKFDIKKYHIFPSLFYNYNLSTAFSFSNPTGLTPFGQIFLKNDRKLGLSTYIVHNSYTYLFRGYQLQRTDLYQQISASQVVAGDELIPLKELKATDTFMSVDLGLEKKNGNSEVFLTVEEIKLSQIGPGLDDYSSIPFFHLGYKKRFYDEKKIMTYWLIGEHLRDRYSPFDGAYVGIQISGKEIPLLGTIKLDKNFFTLIGQLQTNHFNFSYLVKTPHKNPQDGVWVSTIHSLQLSVLF